jgi:Xaa-Pro aminopeptidase
MQPDPELFTRRRQQVLSALGPSATAIFPAAPETIRSNDVEYRYRQHSDFYYLTGFPEPGAVCVLRPGHPQEEYVLFVRPRNQDRETWTGRRAGTEGAVSQFGAAAAYPIDQLDEKMPLILAERAELYYAVERDAAFTDRVLRWMQQAQANRARTGTGPTGLLDPRPIVHELRLHKSDSELARMRQAVAISAAAHAAVLRTVRAGQREFEIEALLEYEFRRGGASGPAYPSIVASGGNATVLHYTQNDRVLGADDLLLIDAGAEFECYCADVTRTFPVGAAYQGRGRALYEVVLAAQEAAIGAIRPGVQVDAVHQRAVAVLVEGLLALGLLSGNAAEIQEKEEFKPFYMHRTSHWLGMDVHDVGLYKIDGQSRTLEPGMVLTVEPGLYVGAHLTTVPAEWHGIGIRIEDDVLVTADGPEVLTAAIPKRIDDVEAIRRDALAG